MGEDVGVRRRGGEQKGNKGGGEEKKAERPKPFQGRYNPKVLPTLFDKYILSQIDFRLQIVMDQSPTRAWPSS